jgi:hypothetical protein
MLRFLRALDYGSAMESGLRETREVALVPSSLAPEVCSAENALTKGDEHEKNNTHPWLRADCTAGNRSAEFDG